MLGGESVCRFAVVARARIKEFHHRISEAKTAHILKEYEIAP